MNLNPWQRIDRVIPGKPFGDGIDGDYNSSTIPTMTYRSCSGSSGSTTLTLTSAGFSNGDLILIHQTRGTGAGQWEINKVVSGGGTTSLTLDKALQYTYTDSGASQAQAVKIPRYTDVTVPSGATWTVPSWNGDTGGILVLAAKGTVTPTGTISASGKGYRGGGIPGSASSGEQGEGTSGAGGTASQSANGSGGGAGLVGSGSRAGGGGGGNGATGSTGGLHSGNGQPGAGGSTAGAADLTSIAFGGGGGSGAGDSNDAGTAGGGGGGIVMIFAKSITEPGSIVATGQTPSNTIESGAPGGGAGGSVLLVVETATLGTNKITALAGSGAISSNTGDGGNGGTGRIAVHHSGAVTGTTSPTFYDNQDPTLVESAGGIFFHNFL